MPDPTAPTRDPLVAACRRLGEAMDLFDADACRALGVGRSDLRALNLLEDGALSAGQVGERLRLTSGSVTTLVDRLVARGYVSRTADPANRRRVLIELQPATYAAFARVYRPLGERVLTATADVAPPERTAAADVLHRMADAFAGFPADRSRGTRHQPSPAP